MRDPWERLLQLADAVLWGAGTDGAPKTHWVGKAMELRTTLPTPRLATKKNIFRSSGIVGGYVVETTPSLTSPFWNTATNAPAIPAGRYVLTNSWRDEARFFRLRQR